MIILRPSNMYWLGAQNSPMLNELDEDMKAEVIKLINESEKDNPHDLCAHGNVEFYINGKKLVSVEDGNFTISAAALFLLRTLEGDHKKKSPLFERLFPHCGHAMYPHEDEVIICCGCPYGKDFEIVHHERNIIIRDNKGAEYTVPFEEWKKAVCSFSDEVSAFYDNSSPRQPSDETDEKGFSAFMREWKRRRGEAGM
jgi:hypothetical protein